MIIEVVVLALVSTVRPTSLAAVYAILSHGSARRFLLAYVVSGLSCTIGFGVLVVGASHGFDLDTGSDRTKAIADIAGGLVMVGFGLAVLAGRVPDRPRDEAPGPGRGLQQRLGRRLTMTTAALAGPLTHIPGIFYLVALNVIVAHNVGAPEAVVAVVIYNAIWFTLPLLALATCFVRPATARDLVDAVRQWVRAHSRTILLATAFLIGPALVVRGVLNL
jgi:hypothetical protein